MSKINRSTIIDDYLDEVPQPKSGAKFTVDTVFNAVIRRVLVSDVPVQISGLGVFKVKERPARVARNPATGESMTIPARRVLTFRPAASLTAELQK